MTLKEAQLIGKRVFQGKQVAYETRGMFRVVLVEGVEVGRAYSWKLAMREACTPWKKEQAAKSEAAAQADFALQEVFVLFRDAEPAKVGEFLFNAYNDHGETPWKTFDGRDVPRWPDLTDAVRAKWTASAAALKAKFVP